MSSLWPLPHLGTPWGCGEGWQAGLRLAWLPQCLWLITFSKPKMGALGECTQEEGGRLKLLPFLEGSCTCAEAQLSLLSHP